MCGEPCFPIRPSRKTGHISTRESTATRLKLDQSTFMLWVGVIISAAVWEFTLLISAYWEWIRRDLSNYKSLRNSPFRVTSFWWWNFKGTLPNSQGRKGVSNWMLSVPAGGNSEEHCWITPSTYNGTWARGAHCQQVYLDVRTGHGELTAYFQAHSLGQAMSVITWAHS